MKEKAVRYDDNSIVGMFLLKFAGRGEEANAKEAFEILMGEYNEMVSFKYAVFLFVTLLAGWGLYAAFNPCGFKPCGFYDSGDIYWVNDKNQKASCYTILNKINNSGSNTEIEPFYYTLRWFNGPIWQKNIIYGNATTGSATLSILGEKKDEQAELDLATFTGKAWIGQPFLCEGTIKHKGKDLKMFAKITNQREYIEQEKGYRNGYQYEL